MKTPVHKGEIVARSGGANYQRNIEAIGGKLHLTNQRLVFEPHRFNVQNGAAEVQLGDVVMVSPCWTRLLGLVPIMPNSILVRCRNGSDYRFALFGRKKWVSAIKDAMNGGTQGE